MGFSSLATIMADNLQVAVDGGADVRYNTKGVKLIQDGDGAVTGIYAQAAGSDQYIRINAKSVVLATGDYLGNEEMMKFYAPECVENGIQILSIDMDNEGNYTNIGEGHMMGAWAGAAIEQWHAPMIHHMGGGAGADGRGVIGNNGFLWLNLRGKRFMNEDLPGQQLENQVELQPQRKAYQFFDSIDIRIVARAAAALPGGPWRGLLLPRGGAAFLHRVRSEDQRAHGRRHRRRRGGGPLPEGRHGGRAFGYDRRHGR